MTKQDLLDALGGHPKADEAIFWWSYCWHAGEGTDLYKIMCESTYIPSPARRWMDDIEIADCFSKLDAAFGPLVEHNYKPVKLADVKEGQVLVAGSHFACLVNRWPCRVYRHHGTLGVACSGGVHGVKLLPGSETTFHPLTEDKDGFVVGFRR